MKNVAFVATVLILGWSFALRAEPVPCDIYLERRGQLPLRLEGGGQIGEKWWEVRHFETNPNLLLMLFGDEPISFDYFQTKDIQRPLYSNDIMNHSTQMMLGILESLDGANPMVLFIGPLMVTSEKIPSTIKRAEKRGLMAGKYILSEGVYIVFDTNPEGYNYILEKNNWIILRERQKREWIDVRRQFIDLFEILTEFRLDYFHPLRNIPGLKARFSQSAQVYVYSSSTLEELLESDKAPKSRYIYGSSQWTY